jgi:type IV secretion system protein VirD4
VVRAYGLMAGYGMQLWAILQDLHQLKSLYGPRAGTFLSNAGVTQVFNDNDVETATWISKTLGATTEAYETSVSQTFNARKNRLRTVRRDACSPTSTRSVKRFDGPDIA